MGCGAACVAMAVGQSYEQTVTLLGKDKARTVGFRLKELRLLLNDSGLLYKSTHANRVDLNELNAEGAIVFIKRSKTYPYGHYLIRVGEKWGDPWINLVENKNLSEAYSGYRDSLPGEPQWVLLPFILKSRQ